MSDGIFKYDGEVFWQFTNSWNVVPNNAIRQYFGGVVAQTWNTEMKESHDNLLQFENTHIRKFKGKRTKDEMYVLEKELELLKGRVDRIKKVHAKVNDNYYIKSVVECFQTEVYDRDFVKKLDTDVYFLGCNNGYIDIRNSTLYPFTKDVYVTMSTGFNYFDENNPRDESIAAEWENFIEQVLPVLDEREIFQTYFGYCLRGDHPEKIFAVMKDKSGGYCAKSKFVAA
ncbi:hypothetical protein HDU88_007893, partial [Geranomyces variabilis]